MGPDSSPCVPPSSSPSLPTTGGFSCPSQARPRAVSCSPLAKMIYTAPGIPDPIHVSTSSGVPPPRRRGESIAGRVFRVLHVRGVDVNVLPPARCDRPCIPGAVVTIARRVGNFAYERQIRVVLWTASRGASSHSTFPLGRLDFGGVF
jgi:hypothetical protein